METLAQQNETRLIPVPLDMKDEQTITQAVEFVRKDLPANIKLWALINTPNEHKNHDPQQSEEFQPVAMEEINCQKYTNKIMMRSISFM